MAQKNEMPDYMLCVWHQKYRQWMRDTAIYLPWTVNWIMLSYHYPDVLIDGLLMDLMDFNNELQSEGTSAKYRFQEQEMLPNNIVHNACHWIGHSRK